MTKDRDNPLHVEVCEGGQAVVVRLSGSAGMAEAETLRQTLEQLSDKQVPTIVLDMTALEFIGSLGLGAIIYGHLRARHHQGRIHLVRPTPRVREMFETTCLTRLFPIYETVEEAARV